MKMDIKYSDEYIKESYQNVKSEIIAILILFAVMGKNIKANSFGVLFKVEILIGIILLISILNSLITIFKSKLKDYININDEYIEISRNLINNKKIWIKDIEEIKEKKDYIVIIYKGEMEYLIKINKISLKDKQKLIENITK